MYKQRANMKPESSNHCLNRQAGFSLVELMIVCLITGILTSIALPNYQYYQRKSKQSEAKIQLSSNVHSTEDFYQCVGAWNILHDTNGIQSSKAGNFITWDGHQVLIQEILMQQTLPLQRVIKGQVVPLLLCIQHNQAIVGH